MNRSDIDKYMSSALSQAKLAFDNDEVPVGAVLFSGSEIYSSYNLTDKNSNATLHAESNVIDMALSDCNSKYLDSAKLFVTLEPCPMCAGKIWLSRISEVYFGAYDSKAGACGSVFQILPSYHLNHRPKVYGGIMERECSDILSEFFKSKRL
jgi:tRNA(adenine34) deaminase